MIVRMWANDKSVERNPDEKSGMGIKDCKTVSEIMEMIDTKIQSDGREIHHISNRTFTKKTPRSHKRPSNSLP